MKTAPTIMQVLPAMEVGGAEQACIDIHAELMKAGSQSIVVCHGGMRLHEITRNGGKHIDLPVHSKNPWVIYRNIGRLRKLIRQWDVDIIHARSRAPAWSCYFACRAEKIPFITTCHAPYNGKGFFKRAYNSIMAKGDKVIAISKFVAQYLHDLYPAAKANIRLVYRGIPIELFHPTSVSPERMIQLSHQWRLPEDASIIMLPGRLTRWKGQHVLIEAMAKVENSNAFALIIGSDQGRKAYRKELEDLVVKYGIEDRVRIVDHCRDMPAAYMLATIVVSASTDPEGFGRVAAESQAMGRITIASDIGTSPETVLTGQTGWLVPPNNATALARAIDKSLAMSNQERIKMANHAMGWIEENFTRDKMVEKTFEVYAEVLHDRQNKVVSQKIDEDKTKDKKTSKEDMPEKINE